MRINLVTPYAEKDAVKALGARWDSTKKLWYVVDAPDLTPFMRWIPNTGMAAESEIAASQPLEATPASARPQRAKACAPSRLSGEVSHCGCNVLPWDDCIHSDNLQQPVN